MFGVTNSLLKYVADQNRDSLLVSQILWLNVGVFGLLFITYKYSTGSFTSNLSGTSSLLLLVLAVAGVCLSAGMYYIKKAVASCPTGLATTIRRKRCPRRHFRLFRVEGRAYSKIVGILMAIGGKIVMSVLT